MSEAGSMVWPSPGEPLWAFDWRLPDYPDEEGLVLRSVRYRNRQLLYKASLPSLRVHYDGPCGPYKSATSPTRPRTAAMSGTQSAPT